jgi:hypothetical protein
MSEYAYNQADDGRGNPAEIIEDVSNAAGQQQQCDQGDSDDKISRFEPPDLRKDHFHQQFG